MIADIRRLPANADLILKHFGVGYCARLQRGNLVSKFDPKLIGIASRRRVWKCAEELLDICEKNAPLNHASSGPKEESEYEEDEE